MDFSGLSLSKVTPNTEIKPFDCGDNDLNDFLFTKARLYTKEHISTTYILENETETIAFFCICNDHVKVEEGNFESKTMFKKFVANRFPHGKRSLHSYPAIKIGRLGVKKNIQKTGLGTSIIDFIIDLALENNKSCACKFISVDAYAESLSFYEKKGFVYFSPNDRDEDTRQMFLDLTPFLNSQS